MKLPILPAAAVICLVPVSLLRAEGPLVVVLDPGHGGKDESVKTGNAQEGDGAAWNNATSATLHLLEKDLTLSYCQAILRKIEASPEGQQGKWKVVMTRTADVHVSAMERAAVAVREGAAIFLSVHFNTSEHHNAVGTRVFYVAPQHPKWEYFHFTNPYADRDKRFATILCDQVADAFKSFGGSPEHRSVTDDAQDRRDGLRNLGYARQDTSLHNCAVALVELEFIDNPTVEDWLLANDHRTTTEEATADAVVSTLRIWTALSPGQRGEQEKALKAPH